MKQLNSQSCNQQGFTLLESLVALVIFAIIVLGSGAAISKMLNVQRDMNVNGLVIAAMQTRLQSALSSNTENTDVCSSINLNKLTVAQTDYFFACFPKEVERPINDNDKIKLTWPVMAASKSSQDAAQACAEGTSTSDCYIVGK